MAKASDLRGRSGGAGPSGGVNPFANLQPGQGGGEGKQSAAKIKPDLGHNAHKAGKAKGGAGGAGGRPKV